MKIIKQPWFIPIVLTIVILAVGNFYMKNLVSNAETLPESEIRKQLEDAYGGKVERLSQKGNIYEVELSRNKGVYLAEVDAETGKVLSLIQTKEVIEEEVPIASIGKDAATGETEKKEPDTAQTGEATTEPKEPATSESNATTTQPKKPVVPDSKPNTSSTGKNNNQTAPPKTPTTVLISENQAIKIAQGQLKGEVDNIDFVQTTDGGYYLVEIENDQDEEATFQIHAISGKILSVTWDD